MKCNVGKTDKVIRIVLAIIIGAVGIYFKSWWGLLGLIPLLTALFSFCPIYSPFKLTTAMKNEGE